VVIVVIVVMIIIIYCYLSRRRFCQVDMGVQIKPKLTSAAVLRRCRSWSTPQEETTVDNITYKIERLALHPPPSVLLRLGILALGGMDVAERPQVWNGV